MNSENNDNTRPVRASSAQESAGPGPMTPWSSAIADSQTLYRSVFHDGPVGLAVVKWSDLSFQAANETFLEYAGFTWQELSGQTMAEHQFLTDLEQERRFYQLIEKHGYVSNLELTYRTKQGHDRSALVSAGTIVYENERCIYVAAVDITARKHAQEHTREQGETLQAILDSVDSVVLFLEVDEAGEIRLVKGNRQAAHWLELSAAETAPMLLQAALEARGIPFAGLSRIIEDANGQEEVLTSELVIPGDGRTQYMLARVRTFRSGKGRLRAVATLTDVTALREAQRAEQEQRILAERLREIAARLNSTLDHERLLDELLEQLIAVLGCDNASLFMTADGIIRRVASRSGKESGREPLTLSLAAHAHIREVFETQSPVIIGDVRTDDRWQGSNAADEPLSWMGVPLNLRGQTIGLLNLSHHTSDRFDEKMAETAAAFSEHAAMAINNARLYQGARREVAERKRMEKALRVSERRYRSLVEDMPILACRFLPDGTLTFVSDNYCTYFGHERKDLIGRSFYSLLSAEDAELVRRKLATITPASPTATYEHKAVDGLGLIRWQRWTDQALFDESGAIIEFQSLGQDITDERLVQELLETERATLVQRVEERTEDLRRQRDRQAALATIKPVMAETEDLDDLLLQVVQIVTESLPASGGVNVVLWDAKDDSLRVAASTVLLATNGQDRRPERTSGTITRRILRERSSVSLSSLAEDRDGVGPLLEANGLQAFIGMPLATHDEVLGVLYAYSTAPHEYSADEIAFLQDMADRVALKLVNARLYEEIQEANVRLAQAVRAKDEFLASVSHELRTPLNGILGMAEALEDELYGRVSVSQKRSLQTIQRSGQHLLALIGDILDLATIESGGAHLALAVFSAADLCHASVQLVTPALQRKEQRLSVSLDQSVGTLVGDQRRLKQILVNLLGNASKFTPEGGAVGLDLHADPERATVRFEVWDTGIGIPLDQVDRLFEPFVQLDGSLARQYEGVGLGLALCARMAAMHGGSVYLKESAIGKGSRFALELPWRETLEAMVEVERSSNVPITHALNAETLDVPTSGPLILVGEDSPANVYSVREYLEHNAFRVIVAEDGDEVLAKLVRHRPDLILMDIQMPGMDGLETTRRIRGLPDPALAVTPIVAVTALTMPGDEERCLAAGADAYQAKPLRLRQLVRLIQSLIKAS